MLAESFGNAGCDDIKSFLSFAKCMVRYLIMEEIPYNFIVYCILIPNQLIYEDITKIPATIPGPGAAGVVARYN